MDALRRLFGGLSLAFIFFLIIITSGEGSVLFGQSGLLKVPSQPTTAAPQPKPAKQDQAKDAGASNTTLILANKTVSMK